MNDGSFIDFLTNVAWITGVAIGIIGGVIGTYCSLKSAKTKKQKKRMIIMAVAMLVVVSLIFVAIWFGSSYIRYGLLVVIGIFGIFGQPILKFLIQNITRKFQEEQINKPNSKLEDKLKNYTSDDVNKIVSKLMGLTQEGKINWKLSIKQDEKRYIAKVEDQYVSLVEKEVDPNDENRILELNLKHQYNNIIKYSMNKLYKQSSMIVPLIEILDENLYTLWTFPYSPANEDLAQLLQYSTANINKFMENIFNM